MESSFSFLLISSFLILPLSMSVSAIAADLTLGSHDSYNGDTNTAEFTPKAATSDTNGTTYNLSGDVSISQAGKKTSLTTSCFSNTAGNLTFSGHGFSLNFDNIASTAAGAVISNTAASGITTFLGFSNLRFTGVPRTTGNGAVKINDGFVLESIRDLMFDSNFSAENGGAINTKTFSLTGSSKFVAFLGNSSSKQGGAIYASGDSVISNNLGVLSFGNNTATTSGGAISAEGNLLISNNQNVFFDGCQATTNGGVIDCSKASGTAPTLTLIGNENLHFLNNTAKASGGALYTNKLVLSSGRGGVLFFNNTASNATPKGGAIAITGSGEISISADLGDIVFEKNSVSTTGTPATITRNAIDLGANAKFLALRASQGKKVLFYDPVTSAGTAADKLSLNKGDAGSGNTYEGLIVFSGEKLSAEELKKPENLKSTFTQPLEIAAGALVLKNGVTLVANTITQIEGSKVVMDGGTTFEASTEGVNLNGLAINVDSLDGTNKATIKAAAASKNLVLSGPIMLVDADGNYYEHHNLSQKQIFPLVELSAQGTITTTDIPDVPILNTNTHYGYQGNWNIVWVEDTTAKTKNATLTWTKTGYKPNPERQGPLVPNSLWGSFVDVRSIQSLMERSTSGLSSPTSLWVSGIANFLHEDKQGNKRGYRHSSAGYALGAGFVTPSENLCNFAFCQLFGYDKDHLVAKNHTHVYAGAMSYQHLGESKILAKIFSGNSNYLPFVLNARLAYGHTDNNMTTKYTAYPAVKGSWGNDAFGIEIGGAIPVSTLGGASWLDSYTPFVNLEIIYAHQKDFKENGTEGRSFQSEELFNLAVPLGIKFEKFSDKSRYDLSLAYVPDLIRSDPDCTTVLMISGDSWSTCGTSLSRQALLLRAGNHYTFASNFEVFSQFEFEWRGSSRSYTVDLGGRFGF
ncbi:autotransporter domain-containing protein [Candidatus Chlamydia corallus]|uniref:autotransporter domain-containing protein n=1 Tax=Candidatus Chlamydia corallus TaxID=2038470 RepID=UPI000C2FA7DF|nr:polymorphic outer membrane protein middle domain-containing protein [Candidatus Chlamydia corallus]